MSYPFSSDTNRIANDAEVAHATAKAESAVPSYSAKIKKRKSKKNQQSNPIPPPRPKEKEHVCRSESKEERPMKKKVKKQENK